MTNDIKPVAVRQKDIEKLIAQTILLAEDMPHGGSLLLCAAFEFFMRYTALQTPSACIDEMCRMLQSLHRVAAFPDERGDAAKH